MAWAEQIRPISAGDQVAFTAAFLRSTGQFAGDVPHARGIVQSLSSLGSTTLADIEWDTLDMPHRVNVANICRVNSRAFGPQDEPTRCGSTAPSVPRINDDGNKLMTTEQDFKRAVLEGNEARTRLFLGGDIAVDVPFAGNATALHHAAGSGKLALVRLLLERGAAVDARDSSGGTPLHWAASIGNVETAKLLLEHGADVDAGTHTQSTPLHRATRYGRVDVVQILVECGANRDAKDAGQLTPLDLANRLEQESEVKEALLALLEQDRSVTTPPPSSAKAKRARSGSKRSKPRQR